MKKFSFHLEPVLKYKGDILESVKNEHGMALRDVVDQEERIRNIEKNKQEYISKFDEKKKISISVAEAEIYEMYIARQEAVLKKEREHLKVLEKIEAEKREKMIEAKKEKLSIEKLKEIKVSQYNKAMQKENELFIEEFVSNSKIKLNAEGI
ncbi:MAG: flagellar export protein FliJ [Firmicutes bacterium]|nr:flagellar export protein FliJ [Bacillota bacterium]